MDKRKKNIKPPWLAKWLLKRLLEYQEKYSITGDLEEMFHENQRESGYIKASLFFWLHCFNLIYKYLIRSFYWRTAMLINYSKIAFRSCVEFFGSIKKAFFICVKTSFPPPALVQIIGVLHAIDSRRV